MDTITDVGALAAMIREELPAGYVLDPDAHTGGGCRALMLTGPAGRMLTVTDGDADLPFTGRPEDWPTADEWGWLVVEYAYEWEAAGSLTVRPALVTADTVRAIVRAWVAGEPICGGV